MISRKSTHKSDPSLSHEMAPCCNSKSPLIKLKFSWSGSLGLKESKVPAHGDLLLPSKRKKDPSKRLFDACSKHPNLLKIQTIVESNPGSVQQINSEGQMPLHAACRRAAPPEVISFLVQRNPKACAVQDTHGRLPLHYLVCRASYYATMKATPFAGLFDVPFEHDKGNTLGLGSENVDDVWKKYIDVIRLICQAHPDALYHEDAQDKTPIECLEHFGRERVEMEEELFCLLLPRARKRATRAASMIG